MTKRTPKARVLGEPDRSRLLDTDVGAFLAFLTVVVVGIWAHHGGFNNLGLSATNTATSLDQITGLLASESGILGLILITRTPMLERRYGLDRMFNWHRVLGVSLSIFLLLHVVFSVWAWSTPGGLLAAVKSLTGGESYMAMATVGAVLVGVVTISSLRSIRNSMTYETWYFIHLIAYIGLAISFSHQITLGADFTNDKLARWSWIGLHVVVVLWIIWSRWRTLILSILHPYKVTAVAHPADGLVAVTLNSPVISRHRAHAGQFYMLRQLMPGRWWKTNPFSLSSVPSSAGLRFTIKSRGESSDAMTKIKVGTKVAIEGPYGVCTPEIIGDEPVLMVAGGVGIGPIVSLAENLSPHHKPIIVYRARTQKEMVHVEEIDALMKKLGGQLFTVIGPRAALKVSDPFAADVLRKSVPDIAERVVIVAGPETLIKAVQKGARKAGVPTDRIHAERAWW